MDKVKEVSIEYGTYFFKLRKMLFDRNISINRLMRDTGTDYKVIKRIMDGELTRLDIQVIGRLCNYFDCSFTDIIEYVSDKNKKELSDQKEANINSDDK